MKNYNHTDKDYTDEIRVTLSFLQFIENKIINKQVYHINSIDMREIKNFSKFMALYCK